MNIWIYLLSIVDGINGTLNFLAFSGVTFGVILFFITFLIITFADDVDENKSVELKKISNFSKLLLIIGAISAIFCTLVPKQNEIIKAYFMYEGATVVNSDNVEKAISEFTKRADKFIKVFEKEK